MTIDFALLILDKETSAPILCNTVSLILRSLHDGLALMMCNTVSTVPRSPPITVDRHCTWTDPSRGKVEDEESVSKAEWGRDSSMGRAGSRMHLRNFVAVVRLYCAMIAAGVRRQGVAMSP